MLAALPWKRIGLVSAGVFVAAMLMILVFELVTGRAVSSYTGSDDRRNSIPVWGDDSATDQDPAPRDDPDGQESVAPDDGASPPAEDEPTAEPTLPLPPTDTTDSSPVPSPDASEASPDPLQPSPSEPTPSG